MHLRMTLRNRMMIKESEMDCLGVLGDFVKEVSEEGGRGDRR